MAEWLVPRVFIAKNGLNIRRISVGLKSCPSRKSIGWRLVIENTSRRCYGWHRPNDEDRMAEWLRPRVLIAKDGLNIRRISMG